MPRWAWRCWVPRGCGPDCWTVTAAANRWRCLNGLAGLACLLPALGAGSALALGSGVLFGRGISVGRGLHQTAMVRHNLPPADWAAGISAFTVVFAFGQIVGPTIVGWIADGPAALAKGLLFSTAALWLGAALAWRQRPL